MKKHHIFTGFLICTLLLCQTQAAMIMGAPEVEEIPLGEEAVVKRMPVDPPAVTEDREEDEPLAQLADGGHTAKDHGGWTALSAAGTLNTGSYYLTGNVTGNLVIQAGATVDLCLNGYTLDAAGSGSVITVNAGATLTLYDCAGGGKVTGGRNIRGGGVYVNGGTLELYGGSITGNQATRTANGGGVCVIGNGALRIYGGSIDHNTAVQGGGVFVNAGCTLVMTGGSIRDNAATTLGGGVCVLKGEAATSCRLSGAPVITDNTANAQTSNLYLAGGGYVSVPAALADDAQVGVSVETPGVFAVPRTSLSGSDCAARFTSDSTDYGIGVNAENRLLVNVPVSITYEVPSSVNGDPPAAQQCIAGETVTVDTQTVLTKEGYGFAGWTNNRDVKKALAQITPTEDTTMYPVFYVGFEESEESTEIDMTYGEDIENIDLNRFIRSTDGNTNATFRFTTAQDLPRGLKLVNDAGEEKGLRHILTGKPMADPGDHAVVFSVNQTGQSAVLFGLDPSPAITTGKLTLTLHIAKPAISAADFDYAEPTDLTENGEVKVATVTPKRGKASGMGTITLQYSPAEPVVADTYQVTAVVAEGTRYQGATLTDPSWVFTITPAQTPVTPQVTLGAPQWSGGRTTIALTPTPSNLLTGARVLAARYENGAMTDLAWGTLSGHTLTFQGKQISVDSGWKVFFLSGNRWTPLCAAAEVR